ncbi:MAG TPA: tyrosine-type recombinase/integrase [Streptosporangiaceae bacterium]
MALDRLPQVARGYTRTRDSTPGGTPGAHDHGGPYERGTTYKQCSCRDAGGRPLGRKCPRLRRGNGWNPDHGRWYYQLELPPHGDGRRRTPLRHGGFDTKTDAEAELGQARKLLAIAAPDDPQTAIRIADAITASMRQDGALPDADRIRKAVGGGRDPAVKPPTTGEWLEEWLAAKKGLRPGTARSYAGHIRLYLKPHLGHIRIDRLRVTDIDSVFEHIEELNDAVTDARASRSPTRRAAVSGRRLVRPATCQRIRATLRSAIGTYMKQHPGALPANVASLAELPPGYRPKALVWTDERVRAWQKDFDAALSAAREGGGRVSPAGIWIAVPRPSPVMVWTPVQTIVFLGAARRHRLHALWRLFTTRGLRRGEGCGLRRPDTDLGAATATIRWQITQLGWDPVQGAPKSDGGERTVALDAGTITDIAAWRKEQERERDAAGDAWAGSGFEFTDELGNPLHPAAVTGMFQLIAYLAGLPPIRLHDLRHGAATLLLAAGHDMKVVQETLGLSSITIAADTYTSVLPQLARKSAEDVAALIRPATQPPAAPTRRRAAGTAPKSRRSAAPKSRPAGK